MITKCDEEGVPCLVQRMIQSGNVIQFKFFDGSQTVMMFTPSDLKTPNEREWLQLEIQAERMWHKEHSLSAKIL